MTRLPLLAVLAPLATGCIIYDDRNPKGDCEDCTIVTATAVPDEDPSVTAPDEPEPEGPQVTDLLALTVNEAVPGATLLSTLVPLDPDIDLTSVRGVTFERDVQVLDTMSRPFEIVLLLAVAPEAALGDVEVAVETEQGSGWILAEPFHVVDAAEGSAGTPGTPAGCP